MLHPSQARAADRFFSGEDKIMFCILVAADDPKTLDMTGKILSQAGYRIKLCRDGRNALTALKENKKIDAVILAAIMPFINGSESAVFIRRSENRKELPIIFLSSDRHKENDQDLIKTKLIDICLPKPCQGAQLLQMVARLLNTGTTGAAAKNEHSSSF